MRRGREARRRVRRRLRANVRVFHRARRRSPRRARVCARPRADTPRRRAARGPIRRRRLRRVDHRRRLSRVRRGSEMPLRVGGRGRRRAPFADRDGRLLDAGGVRGAARSDGVRTGRSRVRRGRRLPRAGVVRLWVGARRVARVAPSHERRAIRRRRRRGRVRAALRPIVPSLRGGGVVPRGFRRTRRRSSRIVERDRVRDPRDATDGGRAGDRSERSGRGGVRRRRRRRVGRRRGGFAERVPGEDGIGDPVDVGVGVGDGIGIGGGVRGRDDRRSDTHRAGVPAGRDARSRFVSRVARRRRRSMRLFERRRRRRRRRGGGGGRRSRGRLPRPAHASGVRLRARRRRAARVVRGGRRVRRD